MDIKYRVYSYSVLSEGNDDYIGSEFKFDLNVKHQISDIIFTVNLSLKNDGIKQLIDNGEAEYLIHIECPYTSYRYVIKTSDTYIKKMIPEKNLNGKVSVCVFIITKKDIQNYYNKNFNKDYDNITFYLERGSVLAIGGQLNTEIIKEIEELSKVPSIFTICRCAEDTDESMMVDLDGNKIAIKLCNSSFQNYKLLSNMPSRISILHSMLLYPALIYTFNLLKGCSDFEDYESRRWFKSIKYTLSKSNIALDTETLERFESYELAQKLLDYPVDRALLALADSEEIEDDI